MAEAWMVRSGQQQRLIDKLVNELREREADEALREIVVAVLAHILSEYSSFGLVTVFSRDAEIFWNDAHEAIRKFSRAPEEEAALIQRFFREVSKILWLNAQAALSRLELADPQKIFHAPSAMAEVDLDHDL